MQTTPEQVAEIARLNDLARRGSPDANGMTVLTPGVDALMDGDPLKRLTLARAIAQFSAFEEGNDPYAERDFGSMVFDGERVFWKVDYFDQNLEGLSEAPWCASATRRVVTVMLASEY